MRSKAGSQEVVEEFNPINGQHVYKKCDFRQLIDRLMIVMTDDPPNELAKPLAVTHAGFQDLVGAFALDLVANHFTLGSMLHVSLRFPDPPRSLRLFSVVASLLVHTFFDSPDPSVSSYSSTRAIQFLSLSAKTVLAHLRPGQATNVSATARMPHCDQAAFTTPEDVVTPLRIKHGLRFAVTFLQADGTQKVMQIDRPVDVASVGLFHLENVWLTSAAVHADTPQCSDADM